MSLVTESIDALEDWMGHSPHPAIVTLPLGAFAVSNLCDVLGTVTRSRRLDDVAQVSMAIGLVGAVGAAATGLRDYGQIPDDRQPNHDIATTHGIGNAAVASLFAASYLLRRGRWQQGRRPGATARVLALAAGGLAVYTGWLGGKLVSELGESVQPVMDRMAARERARRSGLAATPEPSGRERLEAGTPLGPG